MSDGNDGASVASTSSSPSAAAVHLGFSAPLDGGEGSEVADQGVAHASPLWSDWDGGKIGGRPSWLNPRAVPKGPLRCGACAAGGKGGRGDGTVMRFVCQTYCPADADCIPTNPAAFHRTLYAFACPECSSSPTPESVRILRGQLPRESDYYPPTCRDFDEDGWDRHRPEAWNVRLCAVCGLGASAGGRCPVQDRWFCCKEHQREHLRNAEGSDSRPGRLPSLYAETLLVVEDEPPESRTSAEEQERLREEADRGALFQAVDDAVRKDGGDDADDGEEENELDENLEQADLNAMTGADGTGIADATTLDFYSRIGRADGDVRDQCLRYCRWQDGIGPAEGSEGEGEGSPTGPLWISSIGTPGRDGIPPCQKCGAERKFELQLMPQMISALLGDGEGGDPVTSQGAKEALLAASDIADQARREGREGALPADFRERHEQAIERARRAILWGGNRSSGDAMDWGVIAVYTCHASCGDGDAYYDEFAWRQLPLV